MQALTHTPRVLIVEDDLITATIAANICEGLDAQVQVAENGLDAVMLYQKNPNFDLIFMDLEMPKMEGYEATYEIRQHEIENGLSPVPIIAVSGYIAGDTPFRCLKAGMNKCVHKPYTVNLISDMMQSYIAPYTQPKMAGATAVAQKTKRRTFLKWPFRDELLKLGDYQF
ncbi:MAG: response regulator [Rickettsiales bacterium]